MAIMVFVTIPEKHAEKLAKIILKKRVCACVNIIRGVCSFFWWQGKIDKAKEAILMIKTRDSLFKRLGLLIQKNHPYEVAEIIAVKLNKINKEYLAWLNKEANGN